MTIAIYPGSFDPFTKGHEVIAQRALETFDELILAIGTNSSKSPLFTIEERIRILEQRASSLMGRTHKLEAVRVETFDGLLADFALEATKMGEVVIVRGLRAVSDFEHEMALAAANRRLAPEIPTFFIPTEGDLAFVSSSIVKDIARHTHNVGDLVPYVDRDVAEAMINKMRKS